MKKQKYFCTRPRLAAQLIEAGYQAVEAINPWKPQYKAWSFTMSDGLCAIVANFYQDIGKPVPADIDSYMRNMEGQ